MNPAESVNEEWTLYTTTRHGKKLQKLKSYKSKKHNRKSKTNKKRRKQNTTKRMQTIYIYIII